MSNFLDKFAGLKEGNETDLLFFCSWFYFIIGWILSKNFVEEVTNLYYEKIVIIFIIINFKITTVLIGNKYK